VGDTPEVGNLRLGRLRNGEQAEKCVQQFAMTAQFDQPALAPMTNRKPKPPTYLIDS
jgi:hypothetical protein